MIRRMFAILCALLLCIVTSCAMAKDHICPACGGALSCTNCTADSCGWACASCGYSASYSHDMNSVNTGVVGNCCAYCGIMGYGVRSIKKAAEPVAEVEAYAEAEAPVMLKMAKAAPVEEDPAEGETAESELVMAEPVALKSMEEEPAATEPAADEPIMAEPVEEESIEEEPITTEPAAEEPAATEPAADEPIEVEPIVECAHEEARLVNRDGKQPTCTEGAIADAYCLSCSEYIGSINLDPLGHALVEVSGKAATCTEAGWNSYYQCSRCGECFTDAAGANAIADLASWKTGAGQIAAKGHTMTTIAAKAATCTEDGWNAYYACGVCGKNFADAAGAQEIADVDSWKTGEGKAAKLNHDWGAITYQWDGFECTAKRVCQRDADHVQQETVTAKFVTDTPATCLTNATGHYEADFTSTEFVGQQTAANSVELADSALSHDYTKITYTWNGQVCTAKLACANCGDEDESEQVTAKFVADTAGTCEVAEKGHYEATFASSTFTAQQTAANSVEGTAALGHAPKITYTWNGQICTAIMICSRCNEELESETVTAQFVSDTAATCDAAEKGHYEATFASSTFTAQQTEANSVEGTAASGHDWGEATYTWSGDQCTAQRVCKNDPAHIETETVTGEFVADQQGTCVEPTLGHYKAVFTNEAFAAQETAAKSASKATEGGHDWGEASYTWNGDQCTAKRVCKLDASHIETETVTASFVADTPNHCTTQEMGHYKAVFANSAFAAQETEASSVKGADPSGHWFYHYKYNNDATCTKDGTQTAYCEWDCGETSTKTAPGTALGHSYGEWVVTKEPTTTEEGEQYHICIRCGEKKVETMPCLEEFIIEVELTDELKAEFPDAEQIVIVLTEVREGLPSVYAKQIEKRYTVSGKVYTIQAYAVKAGVMTAIDVKNSAMYFKMAATNAKLVCVLFNEEGELLELDAAYTKDLKLYTIRYTEPGLVFLAKKL